jgi:hypothetical protein
MIGLRHPFRVTGPRLEQARSPCIGYINKRRQTDVLTLPSDTALQEYPLKEVCFEQA